MGESSCGEWEGCLNIGVILYKRDDLSRFMAKFAGGMMTIVTDLGNIALL